MDKDVLNKALLLEAFKGIIQNEKLEEVFSRACITNLCYHKSNKKIDLSIECYDCVKPDQIKGLERAISESLNVKVKVRPGFKSVLMNELEDWHKELILARVNSVKKYFSHFLEDAKLNISGRYLNINLVNQSSSILNAAGVADCIEKAVFDFFNKPVKIGRAHV